MNLQKFFPFFLLFSLLGGTCRSQAYIDIAVNKGVQVSFSSQGQWGSGVSFYDFDQDGWDDLTFCMENDSIRFYKNIGGTFVKLPSYIYGFGRVKQVLWVDYDNDGDMDLMMVPYGGKHKLYNNNGSFQFSDVSLAAGLIQIEANGYSAAFGDYNNDGFLDMYICNYEVQGDAGTPHKLNQLYKNNGDGTFTNVTQQAGVGDGFQPSFQGNWFDFDEDGLLDLYVINDRNLWNNSLYKNNGDGTFTNVAAQAGALVAAQDPMTNSVADFDNDGDFDIYMTNTGGSTHEGRLLVNNGNDTFSESGAVYGVNISHWSWGAVWVDYNNNGFQDLYATTAQPGNFLQQVNNFFYVNTGGTGFTTANNQFSPNGNIQSYSVAKGDFNNDGFYDIVQQNNTPALASLFENQETAGNYIKFTLHGTVSNKMAVGSLVKIYAGGNTYTRFTHCGENYVSQDSQHLIVGIGQAQTVDSLVIRYPSGYTEWFYALPVNQHYHFTEGQTYTAQISYSESLYFCEGGSVSLSAGNHETYQWSNGSSDSSITVTQSGIYYVTVYNPWGISAQSDTVWVTEVGTQQFDVDIQNPTCFGASDGSIFVNPDNFTETYSLVWNTEYSGNFLQNQPDGFYSFVYTDVYGCESETSYYLLEPPPILVSVNTFMETVPEGGSAFFDVLGGTPPYTFSVNGVLSENPSENLTGGNYFLLITDANGCSAESEFSISSIVNLLPTGKSENGFGIFPNPLNIGKPLYLSFPAQSKILGIIISDATGREVYKQDINKLLSDTYELFLPEFKAGVYFVTLSGCEVTEVFPLLISGGK